MNCSTDLGDALATGLERLDVNWAYLSESEEWRTLQQALNTVAWYRVFELADTAHGWHPHLHLVLLCGAPDPLGRDVKLNLAVSDLFAKLSAAVANMGLPVPRSLVTAKLWSNDAQ